jgi:integrase
MSTSKSKKRRAPWGTVTTQELRYTRRFKYRCDGIEYFIALPSKGVLTESDEAQIAKYIELDVVRGIHDNSLRSYREMIILGGISDKARIPPKPKVEEKLILHEALKDYYQKTGRDFEKDFYHSAWIMVKNWGSKTTIEMIPQKLLAMEYRPKTFNNRKGILKGFCEWLLRNGRIKYNPVYDIPSRKKIGSKDNTRKSMTNEEIKLILEAIRTDQFVKKASHRFTHSHYFPILSFIAQTGVRPAEAIGLQVKKINFKTKSITIDQSLARSRHGTSSTYRTMKGTKMDDSRLLYFADNPELEALLKLQCVGGKPDDLVFPSPTGVACDDRKINDNILTPVMEGLGIERRILYAFRHSFASRCFEQGMDIKSVQSLTGHKDASVLLNTYAESSKTKVNVPKIL